MPRPKYIRYLVLWLILTAVGLGGLASYNLVIDPYRSYRIVSIREWDLRKDYADKRTSKAELARHDRFEIALVGTSCMQNGLDPSHRAWGGPAVNLGVVGCSPYEMERIVEFTLKHQPLNRVVAGLNFLMFSKPDLPRTADDFDKSLFNPGRSVIEYHLENLLGLAGTKLSSHNLQRIMGHLENEGGPRQEYDLLGFCRVFKLPAVWHLHDSFGKDEVHKYQPDRMDYLRQTVSLCAARKVKLQVVILPTHATYLAGIDKAGAWRDYCRWIEQVVEIVCQAGGENEVWDFSSCDGFCDEPIPPPGDAKTRMKWWVDPIHFTPRLGNMVIEQINGLPESATDRNAVFGRRLAPANLANHLKNLRAQLDDFIRRNPAAPVKP
ncbi:MAG: hypothetical protein HZA50_17485 [Planctomycetes bacterium]|nr:hypothetical protein [Planctomycetota bacterium]